MDFEHLIYEKENDVAYITLNHPEKRNPLFAGPMNELHRVLDLCDYDDSIRVVVIRGAGGNFCGGGDIKNMKYRIDNGIRGIREGCRAGAETLFRLRQVRKPVIAWAEGAIAGAGIALALACDFQIVSETSKCSFAFVNVGLVPDYGTVSFVTRILGTTRTTELFMSGRRFTGQQGAEWGLFTEAVPAEQQEARVREYIEKYRKGPTLAYGNMKELVNRANFSNFADTMISEIQLQGQCEQSEDYVNAVNAFLRKEKPVYIGR